METEKKQNIKVIWLAAAVVVSVFFNVGLAFLLGIAKTNITLQREALEGWKKTAQEANAALLSARTWAAAASAGGSSVVLIPKGSILESSDGGKTFRVNEIGK